MSEPLIFKAQIAPLQSGMMLGPDCLAVKLIPLALDGELLAALFELQEQAFIVTIRDSMGDFSFSASIPDTASAIRPNKKTPQVQINIPKSDSLTGLRLYALYGIVFGVEITNGDKKPKREKKPAKEKGTFGRYWQAMFKRGALDSIDLAEVLQQQLGEPIDDVKASLKKRIGVDSLTFVSPEQFEQFCEVNNLASLITISRNATTEAGL